MDSSTKHNSPAPSLPRREPSWRNEGNEPDYRFSLANERTFLAWIRTALAVLAGAVVLEQFATNIQPRWAVVTLALVLATSAASLCVIAYVRWRANEIAMRHSLPLPSNLGLPVLATTAVVVAGGLGLLLLVPK